MGENETAAFDPIFFFHHCWIDRVFAKWQEIHGATTSFDIITEYGGTNTSDAHVQPVSGQRKNQDLTMDTKLKPFKNPSTGKKYTSRDMVDTK
eukprot:CAMPEP_0202957850 /NCGR_PEP_ID=MMETSP1396-20130829/2229_1 /ASSEMBLY_ACC=CAM_ASM_000872 /TAXON_ID= /ORGANISM="Pseudokeronopsis sp., Strain Brazil" /LENGTH=92 /DNA_ID=CAMNT_0049675569 /DNA_START=898 /DNA_END=1176 /DNA_ORIENTATION=+